MTSRGVKNKDGVYTGRWTDRINFASISDGSSNTFLAGEMHILNGKLNTTPYNGPMFNGSEVVAHSRIGGPGVPILSGHEEPGDVFGFGSAHPGTCNFVRADGSTQTLRNSLDTILLANLCHRSDGNHVEVD